ncbi:MAG: nuclear transport factor 2 family protein [Alphaproteobacteria bacterium]
MSVESITQAQLDAYNAQDLDAYCGFYTDDVVIADVGGAVSTQGNAALRERYAGAFSKFPKNRADLKNRIVLGNTVIDHEYVDRGDGVTPPFEVAAIYTFRGDKIARVDFAK